MIESWNFQHLFANFQVIQLIKTIVIYIFSLGCLIEWKFYEVSRNSFLKRCWKFQLPILNNKKVLFPQKNIFLAVVSKHAKIVPKDGASRPSLQHRSLMLKWFKSRQEEGITITIAPAQLPPLWQVH